QNTKFPSEPVIGPNIPFVKIAMIFYFLILFFLNYIRHYWCQTIHLSNPNRHCELPIVIASFQSSLHPSRRHCESPNRHCILPAVIVSLPTAIASSPPSLRGTKQSILLPAPIVIARYEAIYTTTSSHRHCEVRSNLYVLPFFGEDRFVPREDDRG